MLAFVIQNHSHRAGAHLGRELVSRLAYHGSTFSGVGASDQPGAVQMLDKGYSRRQVARVTSLSRNTIRKMLLNRLPQRYKPRTPRHPALQQYTATLDAFASLSVTTAL